MTFSRTTILNTRESAMGDQWLGQVIPIASGQLGKVSLYLEPEIADTVTANSITVTVSVYALDVSGLPAGSPLAYASKLLSEITTRGLVNFALPTPVPATVGVVLRLSGGDSENYIGWKYAESSSPSTEALLISTDGGVTWTKDFSRKFAYIAYSPVDDAVTFESDITATHSENDQTARIQAGTVIEIKDDTNAEFNLLTLDRAIVDGDSIVINFGDFVITLVVDQSGSMTWNDRQGLRFDFLKAYIDDIQSILPSSSEALYSLLKFNSRKVGRMRILLQGESGNTIAGARVVRKTGISPVSGPTDGIVVYEGLVEEILDANLIAGTTYQYGIFAYDTSGNFSTGITAYSFPNAQPKTPMGVAGFLAQEEVVKNGDYDIGKRKVNISWVHPATTDSLISYDKIHLVRRTDRYPLNPLDGTVLLSVDSSDIAYDGPYVDFDTPGFVQSTYPVAGLTYYYSMFTENTSGNKCIIQNARNYAVTISEVDRFWEKAQPPFDDPVTYGFDPTPPSAITAVTKVIGDGELSFSWTGSAQRYVIYYSPDRYPRFVGLNGGDTLGYDGTVIYDGDQSSFIHRDLDNGQPHFYVIVACDNVDNQSAGFQFTAKPLSGSTDTISPAAVTNFQAEPYNSTTLKLTWTLPIADLESIDGWFGDSIDISCNVTFQDTDTRTTISTLEFIEETRTTVTMVDGGNSITLTNTNGNTTPLEGSDAELALQAVDPSIGIVFANVPTNDSTQINSVFAAAPLLGIQSRMDQISMTLHGLLSVKDNQGVLLTGTRTNSVNIILNNPLDINIKNDPQKNINRPRWSATCSPTDSPSLEYDQLPGVYVKTGESIPIDVDITFKDAALTSNINISVRIIDKVTGQPSTVLVLPSTNQSGVATFQTISQTDEILDRTGEPTGETEDVTRVSFDLPPQDIPGDFTVEVTTSYRGYSRVKTYDVHYEPSLNIDVNAVSFIGDGINVAEQSAFIYFGDPLGTSKIPVPDGTIVDWKITPLDTISSKNLKKRPFFSRDSVPGTGVRSSVVSGTAKNIFFGPGTDIGPETIEDQNQQVSESCAPGNEVYEITATVKVSGMTRTGHGLIILTPAEGNTELNRLFLRRVDGFNTDIIYADGITESAWEVLANPETDGTASDYTSGAFFRNAVTGLGGLVPQLPEGKVITLTTKRFQGSPEGASILIRSDLTSDTGRPNYAKATIINGKATFYLRLNTRVSGVVKEKPLPGELDAGSNIIYGSADKVSWDESALIYSLTVYTPIEVQGRPIVFYGGGSNLEYHTPPCYLAFKEPLAVGTDPDAEN